MAILGSKLLNLSNAPDPLIVRMKKGKSFKGSPLVS